MERNAQLGRVLSRVGGFKIINCVTLRPWLECKERASVQQSNTSAPASGWPRGAETRRENARSTEQKPGRTRQTNQRPYPPAF